MPMPAGEPITTHSSIDLGRFFGGLRPDSGQS
jgi:hypothetical protein